MKLSWLKVFAVFILAVLLSASSWASPSAANTALPGTLNYVEGQAALGKQPVDSSQIGNLTLKDGQSLTTNQGKAEILLTPGVFLRLGDHSSAEMISSSLTNTQVAIEGQAMMEVAEIHPENNLRVTVDGVSTQLVKVGLYDSDANQAQVRVFKGKAIVFDGDRQITVKGGHELDLNAAGKLNSRSFDKKQYEQSDLYRWSSLRSSYLAEANVETANSYFVNGWYGPGWFGGGWYWDPWFGGYTFIPGDGVFFSPFGWGFYSPLVVFRAPVVVGGFHHFGPGSHPASVHDHAVGRPPASAHSSFGHSGGAGFGHSGGGSHGGMGHSGR